MRRQAAIWKNVNRTFMGLLSRVSLPSRGICWHVSPGTNEVLNEIMRSSSAACAILVLLMGTVDAEQCPPGALGVSRTLVVDPNEHPHVGSMQYPDIVHPQRESPFS